MANLNHLGLLNLVSYVHGPSGKGYYDSLKPVPSMKPFNKLMNDQILVRILLRSKDDGKINAGLTKGVIRDEGLEFFNRSFGLLKNFSGHFDGHLFHLLEVALKSYAHIHQDSQFRFRKIEIGHMAAHQFVIRDDQNVVREGSNPHVPPPDSIHITFFSCFKLNIISDPDRFI